MVPFIQKQSMKDKAKQSWIVWIKLRHCVSVIEVAGGKYELQQGQVLDPAPNLFTLRMAHSKL